MIVHGVKLTKKQEEDYTEAQEIEKQFGKKIFNAENYLIDMLIQASKQKQHIINYRRRQDEQKG